MKRSALVWLATCIFGMVAGTAWAQSSLLPDSLTNAPDSVKVYFLQDLGDSLSNNGQLPAAKLAIEEALSRALASGHPGLIGSSYRSIGYWYMQVNEPRQALTNYHQALHYLRQHGKAAGIARTYNYISSAYLKLNDLAHGRSYLEQAIAVAQKARNSNMLMELNGQLAILEAKSGRHDRALILNQKAAAYYLQEKDSLSYYSALFNLAITYKNLGQYARSEALYRKLLAYSLRTGDKYIEGYVYTNMPNALIPQGKLDEAELLSKRALAWSEQTGTERFMIQEEAYDALSRLEQQRGRYQQALTYFQRKSAAHDSVFNATRNRQLAEVETRFQTQEKEAQIQALDAINAQKTRQIWAGAGGLLLLSALSGTLFVFYRRIRRNRAQIQQQSEQLTLMMKELHHRVKNNLAIVSSLLRLQSNRLDDEKAIAAVRVGQQRVEAMSLIHQRLYQTDRVSSVNMREFLTDLSESLMRAYGYAPDAFDLRLDIKQEEVDVDVAMPLGLIVNELITNAFKYAYADVQRPQLRISLHRNDGLTLEVQDNGPGLDTADWQQAGQRTSFGKRLIHSLSDQLDGQLDVIRRNGTLFRLHIPQSKLRTAA